MVDEIFNKIDNLKCKVGKHRWKDRIKIMGKITEKGIPCQVYQKCEVCKKLGKWVKVYIEVPNYAKGNH